MQAKLLFCLIFASLCTSFVSWAQQKDCNESIRSAESSALLSAICELNAYNAQSQALKNEQLIAKAELLSFAGKNPQAYSTVCRVPLFGLSLDQRRELYYLKMKYAYEASEFNDFAALLSEALSTSILLQKDSIAIQKSLCRAKPKRKSQDLAMLLSVIPGLGNAYVGDPANATKYFLTESAIIATGVGAFISSLYISAFVGGGMLLYSTLPVSTDKAVKGANEWNNNALKEYYAPAYRIICGK